MYEGEFLFFYVDRYAKRFVQARGDFENEPEEKFIFTVLPTDRLKLLYKRVH